MQASLDTPVAVEFHSTSNCCSSAAAMKERRPTTAFGSAAIPLSNALKCRANRSTVCNSSSSASYSQTKDKPLPSTQPLNTMEHSVRTSAMLGSLDCSILMPSSVLEKIRAVLNSGLRSKLSCPANPE